MKVKTTVSVGITTVVGWLVGIGGLLPMVAKSVEEGQVAAAGPEKWLAIAAVVSLGITNAGRYLQALFPRSSLVGPAKTHEYAAPQATDPVLAKARELISEHPGVVQQLKSEGLI